MVQAAFAETGAFGDASGVLDLRFMPANADIQKGDMLVTSGIDGIYPPGLSVATVQQVETKSTDAFAHIVCLPAAGVDRHKQLLILLVEQTTAPRPDPEGAGEKVDKLLKRRLRDSAKESDAVSPKDAPNEERKGVAPVAGAAAAPAAKPATPPAATPAQPAKSTR
ncbi:rod shape-determining protein MreC [Herbaspirillum lusitanum]|uniref:rod shape-determining protein MreC n=1 Tax=Herbaspirillum lusitanum TaxID=213312 RepID=UPI002EDAE7F1